jgi:GT2 family glycosyltransferase
VASTETPDLSIVIVTHNGGDLAMKAIESAMEHGNGIVIEWVIVDSGSTDRTPDAIEARWPAITVQRLANVGFAAANNAGFALARGRYLLALNPDTEIRSGQFADLVAELDARPQIGAASVIQEFADGRLQPSIRRDPTVARAISEALLLRKLPGLGDWQELEHRDAAYRTDRPADWLVGAFLLLRADVVRAIGGFDERFFMYSEEADLCRRVRESGHEIRHLPTMRILHHGGSPSPRLVAQHAFSRIEYARKHLGVGGAAMFRAAVALHHFVRMAGFAVKRGRGERVSGESHALKVALGIAPPPYSGPTGA